jgi:UDP-N-acetylmuramate dehydrogenase
MTSSPNDLELALDCLGDRAVADRPLGELTTYRVGGPAAVFVEVRTRDDLKLVAEARRRSGLPVLVLGRGSNLLIADGGFRGIAVLMVGFDEIVFHDGDADVPGHPESPAPDRCIVEAGAAVPLPVAARQTVAGGLTGFEWAVGVPGSIGGAVRMNAGGHGADMASSLLGVWVMDLDAAMIEWRAARDLGLAFRSSGLKDHEIVLSATLVLARGDRAASEQVLSDVVRWRREHQPGGQNCGSVFVNPIPGVVPAAALVEQVGLRGHRVGTARVSEKHANFIQADEGGRAADVMLLIEQVRAAVVRETGYLLRSEVRLVGFEGQVGSRSRGGEH